MSFRIEEKILIDKKVIIDFKKLLTEKSFKPIFKPRIIQSLYFENSNYEMYNDSIEGLTPRKKIRIRNYPESQDNFLYLEIKISSVEGRFKTRKIINKNLFEFKKKNGIIDLQYGHCKPCINIVYEREYFKLDDVRISIDNNINYKVHNKNVNQTENNCIVEIKTSIKKNIDQLVKDFPFQKQRFSKYCNAIEKVIFNENLT
ncbi:VTC domain-containing protein [bacterium]|nr:VTC domain-containing protein [bacterium]